MFRNRRSRPPRPEAGFTLVEVMVAAAVTIVVLVAAAELMASMTVRTAKIQEAEQARAVAYQVSERAKALGCGAVYASDPDLDDRAAACAEGLGAGDFATPTGCAPTGRGDTTFCWTDTKRTYQVTMQTGWDYSSSAAGPPAVPDVCVRRFTVRLRSARRGSAPLVDGLEFREAAPERVGLGGLHLVQPPTQGAMVSCRVGSNQVQHSSPASNGKVLFPYKANAQC